MLSGTIDQQTRELNELRSQNTKLLSNIGQFETRLQDAERDKLAAFSKLDVTLQEISHLRAEKDLFKATEVRFGEEREMLLQERNRLNELIRHLQNTHGELERKANEERRRLEDDKDRLVKDVSQLRAQVSEEAADLKALSSRKDAEIKEWQQKLESQAGALLKTRESLAAQESRVRHLEERIAELSTDLRKKEDEIRQLHVRQASRSPTRATQSENMDAASQEFENQLQRLRQELEEAKTDAERQRKHAEDFLEISKSAEEKLAENNQAFAEYEASTQQKIRELEVSFGGGCGFLIRLGSFWNRSGTTSNIND
jgi:chromosome segregation ATPase